MIALSVENTDPTDEFTEARIEAARAARELLRTDHCNVALFAKRTRAAADALSHLASLAALAHRRAGGAAELVLVVCAGVGFA